MEVINQKKNKVGSRHRTEMANLDIRCKQEKLKYLQEKLNLLRSGKHKMFPNAGAQHLIRSRTKPNFTNMQMFPQNEINVGAEHGKTLPPDELHQDNVEAERVKTPPLHQEFDGNHEDIDGNHEEIDENHEEFEHHEDPYSNLDELPGPSNTPHNNSMKEHTEPLERGFRCPFCPKGYTSFKILRVHILKKCQPNIKQEELNVIHDDLKKNTIILCPICGKKFTNVESCRLHARFRMCRKPKNGNLCEICVRVFSNRSNLLRHTRAIHEAPKSSKTELSEKELNQNVEEALTEILAE